MLRIYRVVEDGEPVCVAARSMQEAVALCIGVYVSEEKEFADVNNEEFDLEQTIERYHSIILEEVVLMGELRYQEVVLC